MEPYEVMILPRDRRPGKPREGVIQIRVTSHCDGSCPNCTQLCDWRKIGWDTTMTPEQFERAVASLRGYWGVVGVFGGNPCLHSQFALLCEILQRYFPAEQCGLWSNRIYQYGPVCAKTFNPAYSNLNVHGSREAFNEIRRGWPEAKPFGLDQPSRHPPILTAVQDLLPPEQQWAKITRCDINRHWSAMVAVVNGRLRGYFCEIAGALATFHYGEPDWPDLGVTVEPGWWKQGWEVFGEQARFYCPRCGVPLRGWGSLDRQTDAPAQVTRTHYSTAMRRGLRRPAGIQHVTRLDQLGGSVGRVTCYLQNAKLSEPANRQET